MPKQSIRPVSKLCPRAKVPPVQGLPPPQIHPDVFIAGTAQIIGDVQIGEAASVWHYAVLRGDANAIRIGRRANIQDGAIVHCRESHPVSIGDGVSIGHGTILHGCTIASLLPGRAWGADPRWRTARGKHDCGCRRARSSRCGVSRKCSSHRRTRSYCPAAD